MPTTKVCTRCHRRKEVAAFGAFVRGKNGLRSWCRDCFRDYGREYVRRPGVRERIRKNGLAATHRYNATPRGKAARKAYAQSEARKKTLREHAAEIRKNRPELIAAHNAVNVAIRQGRLPRPSTLFCACGATAREYHHHKGYTKKHWLDVLPICKRCHTIATFGRAVNC